MNPFIYATIAALCSLVLGSTADVNGVPVRRASLFGYEVGGQTLTLAEAVVAVMPAPVPANDAPALVARGRVALFGVVYDYEYLGQPGYYRLSHGRGKGAREVLTHPAAGGRMVAVEVARPAAARGPSVAFLSLGVVEGRLEVVR